VSTRLPDWRPRLASHVAAGHDRPFAYGRHDCAMFAAGAVEAVTGRNPLRDLGSAPYSTLRGGLLALARSGYRAPLAYVRARVAAVPVAFARQGDLALGESPEGAALGVVGGATVLVPGTTGGLAAVPLTDATSAFEV
jgi:hypothetical protein